MPSLSFSVTTSADLTTAFNYVADYTTTPKWFYGIKTFTPITDQTRGLGSTFNAELQMGATLKAVVETTEFVEGEVLTLESIKGIKNRSRWTFAANGDGGTDLAVDFTFHLGGGIAGSALSRLVEPFVAITVKHTANSLVAQLNQ